MTTLTPTQLAEIEARADAATKGPWIAAAHGSGVVGWPVVASSGRSVCAINYVHHSAIDPAVPGDKAFNAESKRNAAFLAHARQDIPALIAHARALEARLSNAREAFLNIIADAKEFDENYDGDCDGDGRAVTTLDYTIRCFPAYALTDLCAAFGIKADRAETLKDAICRVVFES